MSKVLEVPMPAPGPHSVHLVNRHPGHSKYYDLALRREGTGWVVMATYGAIGGNATPWPVVQNPVPFAQAWEAYAKRVKEQIEKKSYTTNLDGVTMVPWQSALGASAPVAQVSAAPVEKQHSGWEPLLLKDVDESEVSALVDGDDWCAQEKMDGHRIALEVSGAPAQRQARGINRTGYYRPIPDTVVAKARGLPYDNISLIDGELVGDDYYAFDLLRLDGIDVRRFPYAERWGMLADLVEASGLVLVPIKRKPGEKADFIKKLKAARAEGVVFKRLSAPYLPGRTDSYRRYKFTKELDAVVAKVNDRRSVALKLRRGNEWVDVGNVTISKGIPKVNDVVRVRYLYCVVGGKLYQPRILEIRKDKNLRDCTYDQIVFKRGDDES